MFMVFDEINDDHDNKLAALGNFPVASWNDSESTYANLLDLGLNWF